MARICEAKEIGAVHSNIEKNKENAAKKEYNHVMGPGGYRIWVPRLEKMENELRARGIRPGTEGWDPRAKSWWYGHGGTLNPETGECVYRGKIIKPTQALIDAMRDAQEGKIKFNRENDALTKALGNPEHGGRVRGMGHIPWKIGFPQNDDPTITEAGRERWIGKQMLWRGWHRKWM